MKFSRIKSMDCSIKAKKEDEYLLHASRSSFSNNSRPSIALNIRQIIFNPLFDAVADLQQINFGVMFF